ncbi:MAG: hypothetical protein NXI01_00055 [Gammaproteobacteria bacterium]|nr:hypothetical protein [Gammaproteobacteria bacterium]
MSNSAMDVLYNLFDSTATSTKTAVPQYIIDAQKGDVYLKSQDYFTVPENAMAQDQSNLSDALSTVVTAAAPSCLAVEIHEAFDVDSQNHKDFLIESHRNFQAKFDALILIDRKLVLSILTTLVAVCAPSFIPFLGLLTLAGLAATTYFAMQRGVVYLEYTNALSLLAATCNWALGNMPKNDHEAQHISSSIQKKYQDSPEISSMMGSLYRVLSKTQVAHLIDDEIESMYLTALEGYNQAFSLRPTMFNKPESRMARVMSKELENAAMKKTGTEFIRAMYGLNRGNGKDIINMLIQAIPDLFRLASNTVHKMMTPEHTSTPAMSRL